jgi:hypothetical protein
MKDRFGALPPATLRLFDVAKLRLAAASLGADRIEWRGNQLKLWWPEGRPPTHSVLERVVRDIALPLEFVGGARFQATISLGREFRASALAEGLWTAPATGKP